MQIGQVAAETGVSVQTIRLYERMGLIPPANRSEAGYRKYPSSILDHVRAVKQGQQLGFTLAEMKVFVDLHQPPLNQYDALQRFLSEKIAQLDERIAQMIEMRDGLSQLSAADYNWNVDGDCPIVRLLSDISLRSSGEKRSL